LATDSQSVINHATPYGGAVSGSLSIRRNV